MKLSVKWLALLLAGGCATAGERLHARGTPMSSGMRVVDEARVLPAPPDAVVDEVVAWWVAQYPAQEAAIRDFVARGTIIVSAQPAPLVDPTTGRTGRYGMTRDNVCQVWWNTSASPAAAAVLFDATLRHELGHVALSAAWRAFTGLRDDHAVMKSIGYPWAHRRDGGGPARVFAWSSARR